MRSRTPDELSAFLRDDLAWRRKENKAMETLVRATDSSKQQAVLRGAIAALYAHWEGFVKAACRAYLDFVIARRLKNNELAIPLLGLVLRHQLKQVDRHEDTDSHAGFAQWLLKEWGSRARFPATNDAIGTSNLDAKVFKGFIKGLGLPYVADYERAEKPVIDSLVHERNNLAHGEWHIVEVEDYQAYCTWIDRLLTTVCDHIENAAVTSAYLRSMEQLA